MKYYEGKNTGKGFITHDDNEVGYIEDYFPRQVEDYKSFKKFLDENDDFRDTRNQVEQALEDYRVKLLHLII